MGPWLTGRAVIRPPKGMAAFTGCERGKGKGAGSGCQGGEGMSFGMGGPCFWRGLAVWTMLPLLRCGRAIGFGLFLLTICAWFALDALN